MGDKEQRKQEEINLALYLDFRKEIDRICVPEILKCVSRNPIFYEDKQVGLFCYAAEPTHIYIDCLYIEPEYRRKGLAKKSMELFYECFNDREIRLHIVNENKAAYDFWNSVFVLKPIEHNFVDTLYKVVWWNG